MSAVPSVALRDVAAIERGIVEPSQIKSGTLFVGLENIESGGRFVDVRPVDSGELASSKFVFSSRHLLYGKLRPYLAKIARPNFDGVCSTDILPVLPGPALDRGYLAWLLLTPEMVSLASSRATGANLPRLSPTALAEMRIPLPSLHEQRRIAAILDKADALRAKRRVALEQLDTLAQAVFLDMFGDPAENPKGWPRIAIGDLAEKFSDGPFGSNLKSEHYTDCGVRVVRLQNIGVGEFLDEDKAFISEQHFAKLHKHECLPGDVLIGTLGDPNLRACIQPDQVDRALNKADCVQLRPDKNLANAAYLCTLLNCPSTEKMAQGLVLGQTRLRISMGRLRGMQVPVPPVKLQTVFEHRLARIDCTDAAVERSRTELDALFASLQHRAFQGEL